MKMKKKNYNYPKFYMAWHKDPNVLKESSSGGVFTALADYVFANGGIVCGAALNPTTRKVQHILINKAEDLPKLRLSKYYQSEINDIYIKIKDILKNGTLVLFTGTACQVAALYQICGRPENLITADVLCHGVTSKYVVDSYIKSQEKAFKKNITNFYFRVKDKIVGWSKGGGTRMKLEFSDGSSYIADKETDTFFVGFNKNLILRESCYNCKYCGTNRISDFTIGDFWGVTPERATEEERQNGISLLLVNSNTGNNILEKIKNSLYITSINPDEAIPYNLALVKPNKRPDGRDRFFSYLRQGKDYNFLIKRFYVKKYIKNNLKSFAKKILGDNHYKKVVTTFKSLFANKEN